MSRDYSDSDDAHYNRQRRADSVRASGWQSPSPATQLDQPSSSSSSVIRIVVEPPFGAKKCDFAIDKSQRGRLIVTARRRQTFSSDYRSSSSNNKREAIQTFIIPTDADVDQLQSYIERSSNRLIIEIPRHRRSSYTQRTSYSGGASKTGGVNLNVEQMLTSPTGGPQLVWDSNRRSEASGGNRKLEYRIDCHGYKADELEVFIQGRDLIVQGKTRTSATSPIPSQQRISKKFSRKIHLPNTVDLARVVSHFENGELRIEAPLIRGVRYSNEEIVLPGPPPPTQSISHLVTRDNLVRSPSPTNLPQQHHYRRHERVSRRRDYDRPERHRAATPMRRVRSADGIRYPLYVPPWELDEEDADEDTMREDERNRGGGGGGVYRQTTNQERRVIDRGKQQRPTSVITTTGHRSQYQMDDDDTLRF